MVVVDAVSPEKGHAHVTQSRSGVPLAPATERGVTRFGSARGSRKGRAKSGRGQSSYR